jgi:hypothetical protein
MASPVAVDQAASLMVAFAERTGVTGAKAPRRYLWTDAFAVCNFLGLARATGQERYTEIAQSLVAQVHQILGRHRADGPRSGWLSGLSELEGLAHPTFGGLRIGKKLPERSEGERFDERLEWDRDGQYFHYLTKWMHALDQMAHASREARYNSWARELAIAAHRGFVSGGWGAKHMVWKMSTDLSRVLVPSMGQHDPLDGWITYVELEVTANQLHATDRGLDLRIPIGDFVQMARTTSLVTQDPLGLGGLLVDVSRVMRLLSASDLVSVQLLELLLRAVQIGLGRYALQGDLSEPVERRLAFRELGLAIGIKALGTAQNALSLASVRREPWLGARSASLEQQMIALSPYRALSSQIESFWLEPANRTSDSWIEHQDINDVMLATCLAPEGFLGT